jgi:hypothetical protein
MIFGEYSAHSYFDDRILYQSTPSTEMKTIAALSDKALLALPKSINWRKGFDNYCRGLLFTINNLKTKSRKAKP